MTYSPMKPKILDLNRCVTVINRHSALEQIPLESFYFVAFWNLNPLSGGSGDHLKDWFKENVTFSPMKTMDLDLYHYFNAINWFKALEHTPKVSFHRIFQISLSPWAEGGGGGGGSRRAIEKADFRKIWLFRLWGQRFWILDLNPC